MNNKETSSDISNNKRLWTHWAGHILGTNPPKEHLILEHKGKDLTSVYRRVVQAWEQLNQITNKDPLKDRKSWNTVMKKIKHRERDEKRKDIQKFCIYGVFWIVILLIIVWAIFS
ncbi:hypothetical protein K5X82_12855 [Halosquirtibacter xylanolyticus]|uniref:hypothetical protein n=1 Tax=Halosquirtibacter xylanolyticus TaxID=3374599 RepID=UPI00374926D4|nr:hypothetical protein K5X82_12855 [Prolixibacteraceae bacterium]